MKKDVLSRDYWVFDGLTGIIFGFGIGYFSQLISDSGERHLDRMLTRALVCAGSYLFTTALSLLLKGKFPKIPSWIWISILGAIVLAITGNVAAFINDQHYFNSVSFSEYVYQRGGGDIESFIVISIILSLLLFMFFVTTRVAVYVFEKLLIKDLK